MKKKIMIIDDNKELLEELKETISLCGYEVVTVSDAILALDAVNKEKPDVILLDLKMPGKSGFQIAYELKDFKQYKHIPIIAITGFLNDDYVSLMKICGIQSCLTKPFGPLEIVPKIEALFIDNSKSQ